jgi:hypothetical protein
MYLPRPSWLSQSSIVCIERLDPHHSSETSANIVAAPADRKIGAVLGQHRKIKRVAIGAGPFLNTPEMSTKHKRHGNPN